MTIRDRLWLIFDRVVAGLIVAAVYYYFIQGGHTR